MENPKDFRNTRTLPAGQSASVGNSGNSDVDVNVVVDTTPIAFALMYNMYAAKQMSKEQFEEGINKLKSFTGKKTTQQKQERFSDPLDAVRFFPSKREA